jgi:hypothetical protein
LRLTWAQQAARTTAPRAVSRRNAQEALRRIAALYAIERRIRGRSAEDRRNARDVGSATDSSVES